MMGRKGRDILLKISDGKDPENFVTLAGIRSREISLNARPVDVTNADSPDGWRELLVGAAVKSVRIVGRGVFKDADSDQRMRVVFLSGVHSAGPHPCHARAKFYFYFLFLLVLVLFYFFTFCG